MAGEAEPNTIYAARSDTLTGIRFDRTEHEGFCHPFIFHSIIGPKLGTVFYEMHFALKCVAEWHRETRLLPDLA